MFDPLDVGSSPLSRGIQLPGQAGEPDERIIPALAGNTGAVKDGCFAVADHPRSRGEYGPQAPRGSSNRGSSPLSRGILIGAEEEAKKLGIIPALAGNTHVLPHGFPAGCDHPRSRGEYEVPRRLDCRTR